MREQTSEPRRRFRFVLLEERIAPTGFGSGGGYHHHSGSEGGDGSSDISTPVVTTVTVQHSGQQTSSTFVDGVMTGSTTTNNTGPIANPIMTMIPAGTPYTYNGAGFTISYYVAPPVASATGTM